MAGWTSKYLPRIFEGANEDKDSSENSNDSSNYFYYYYYQVYCIKEMA